MWGIECVCLGSGLIYSFSLGSRIEVCSEVEEVSLGQHAAAASSSFKQLHSVEKSAMSWTEKCHIC